MLAGVALLPRIAHADATSGLDPYEEFGKHLRAAQTIAPLADNAFGDRISLYNGATEFNVTDFAIPGNDTLPVALGRRFTVDDRRMDPGYLGGFGDWDVEIPYIEAVVTTDNGWTLSDGSSARCSDTPTYTLNTSVPGMSGPVVAPLNIIWDGDQLHIPGMGNQELLVNNQSKSPADASASTYKWVTTDNWKVGCLSATANGYPGEAFVAVSPTGTTYTFNWVVVHTAPSIFVLTETNGTIQDNIYADRQRVFMLATQVQDRFGNKVTYSYNSSNQLTGITSSDGRSITLTWSGNTIASASSALGTWQYGYGTDSQGRTVLTSVTRPDGSQWTYTISSGALETYKPAAKQCNQSDPCPTVHCQLTPYENTGNFTYVIGAPSGAQATYSFQYQRHYRTGVPLSCNDGNPDHAYPLIYTFSDNFSLVSKQITGPGLPSGMAWTYDSGGVVNDESGTAPGYFSATVPYDSSTLVYLPGGSCGTPNPAYTVTVTGPVSITQYAFGRTYGCDDGRLYGTKVEDLSSNVLQTTGNAYLSEDAAPNEPFASIAGVDQLGNDIHPTANRNRPLVSTQIVQDGATFTTAVNSFDDFARSTSETESSTLGYSKTDTTTYQDDLSRWVLGQVSSTSVLGAAVPCAASTVNDTNLTTCTIYDSNTDLPTQTYGFGKLVSTKAWNGDGTLASVADGDTNVTTLSNWYRGLPQTVGYANGTSESATVNAAGWITSVTDENGFTTNYAYDAMGRLAQISYPTGDDVAWNPTLLSFTQIASTEFGIPAGHWKQVVHTGNDYAVTYFDAFWRPLVTEHYDAGNQGGTLSQIVQQYDAGSRKIFASYPTASATSYTQSLPGVHTTYDALDRVTQAAQDSELGSLPTTTAYLSGFQTQVTNPRGNSTTTSYMAYGEPTTQWPVSISEPQGVLTTILRDVFGKPSSITRTGTASGSPSLTRSYIYDGYQQLCKRIEPESGATAFGYDGAGNLAWSASGLNMPDGNCDASAAESSGRVVSRTYDKRNRLYTVSYPDGSSNVTFGYYADGALQTQTVSNGSSPVTTNYYYDRRRLLTSETLNIPNTSPFTLTYGYDANGHLASTTYPDGRTIGHAPNALGQPTQAGTYATGATYYPNGAIAGFTFGNGLVHTMTESERGLVDRSADSYGGTSVHDDTYAYDGDANVAAITDNTSGNVGNRDMTYDALDRLTEADSPMFGSGSNNKAIYQYDVLDNLLSASVGSYSSVAYSYNADGQLVGLVEPGTVYNLHTYTYDVQGNLANKDGEAYQFDMANRLRNVPGVGSYLYDAAGRRVQKNETLYGGILLDSDYSKAGQLMYQWQPSTQNATDYIYLGDTLVARVVANNAISPPPNVPPIPASISVAPTSDTTGTFSISWQASSGATSYVLWQNANNGGWDSAYTGASTSTTINGLPSGNYVYRVQACNSSGCSGFATSGTVTVISAAPASISVPAYSFTTSIPVSWQASSLANNYVLEEYPYNGGWGVAYEGGNTSYTATVPGSGTYQFQVAACGAGGCSGYTTSGNVIVTLPPSLSASTTSSLSGTFTLNWNAVPTATGYNLSQNGTTVYTGSGTSWSSSNLGNGNYTYTVQSCNASGCGGASNAVTVAVNHIAAPSLSASTGNSTSGTFSLSWNAVTNATSYQLYQGGTLVYNSTGTSWSSNALPNGTYTYTVYGCNGSTCGFASNQVTVTVLHVPPAPILSANESTSTNGSFGLSWNATTGASSYNLYQNGTSVYNAAGTSWSASGLGNGTYTYTVDACNASGCSASNAVTVTVVLMPPSSTLSDPVSSTTGTFTLSWTSASNSTRYQLNQSLNGGSATAVYNSTGLSFTTSALASGTYTYVVYACDQSVCAPPSNSVKVIVSPIPIAPPSMTAPTSVTSGVGFGVSWSGVSGATSYNVRKTNLNNGNVATIYTGGATSAVVTISLPDTYQLAVQACDAKGCSAWTNAPHTTTVNSSKTNALPATGSSS